MIDLIFPIIFGILTVLSAVGVVLATNPLNSALSLILTLFLMAAHYALLNAQFIAVMQILVYTGAIMVLVVFVVMLLGLRTSKKIQGIPKIAFGFLASASFAGLLAFVVTQAGFGELPELSADFGSTKAVGKLMVQEYSTVIHTAGLLLLAAMVGAVLLGKEERRPLRPGRGLKAKRES